MKMLIAKITKKDGKVFATANYQDKSGCIPVIVGDNLSQVMQILTDYANRNNIILVQ